METIILKAENLNKTFGSGHSAVIAVDNISLEIKKEEIVLIMGPSGSGKTTLLTILGSLLTPDSGKIYYENINITNAPKADLPNIRSRDVGFVFQSFNLLSSLNVWENVAVVLELVGTSGIEAKKSAENILKSLGLEERLNYSISDLSGGEKQRVSIARALVANPKIVFADEPTANLDSKSGHKVIELLKNIAKKSDKAVIIVSHDMRLMDTADRVLWLEDGKLKESHEKLVTDPICEMTLQQRDAPYNLKYDGQTYYFCSKKCLSEFNKKIL